MGSINNCKPTKDTYKVYVSNKNGIIGACSPTKDTYVVYVPNKTGSIGACSPTETPQLNEDLTDTNTYCVSVDESCHQVSSRSFLADVPTYLLRWFVEKNGNKKLQQCYHVFKPDSYDYEVIWKDIKMVYEE